jgi:hypothetical protein
MWFYPCVVGGFMALLLLLLLLLQRCWQSCSCAPPQIGS